MLYFCMLLMCNFCMYAQGILKQVLTEGERYIMTIFSVLTFAEQGVYDVVNNLGSMAARFLFMPIEESSYFYFAQMTNRQLPIEQQPRKDIEQVYSVLRRLLRSLSLLGISRFLYFLVFPNILIESYQLKILLRLIKNTTGLTYIFVIVLTLINQ